MKAIFESPEELQEKIEEYLRLIQDEKEGGIYARPSVSGLALHLGFESRQSFYDYEKRDDYSYTIKKARFTIENYYEMNLSESNATGSIFALKNLGWKDKVETEHSGAIVQRIERKIVDPTN